MALAEQVVEEEAPAALPAAAAAAGGDAEMAEAAAAPAGAAAAGGSDAENRDSNQAEAAAGDKPVEGGEGAAAMGGERGAAEAPPLAKKTVTKVTQQKFNNVKARGGHWRWWRWGVGGRAHQTPAAASRPLLALGTPPKKQAYTHCTQNNVHKIMQARNNAPPPSPPAQNLLVLRLQQLDESGEGEARELGGVAVAGASQKDLLRWYFDYLSER